MNMKLEFSSGYKGQNTTEWKVILCYSGGS